MLGNSPISADRAPKGNAPDRGTGGRFLTFSPRIFSFFEGFASGLRAVDVRPQLDVCLIRCLSNYLTIDRDRLDVCLIVSIAFVTLC